MMLLPFEIGACRPGRGKRLDEQRTAGGEPVPATEYATHFPSGEKVAAGGSR